MLITISNTRSKRVNENITRQCTRQEKNVYMQIFMFVGVSIIEILLFNRKKKQKKNMVYNSVKIEITCITPVLQAFLDFFQISLVFNMFSTLVLVEVKLSRNLKLKMKTESFRIGSKYGKMTIAIPI